MVQAAKAFAPTPVPGRNAKQTRRQAEAFQRLLAEIFNAQARWLGANWHLLLTPGERDRLTAKRIGEANPQSWAGWDDPIAVEVRRPLGRALQAGAQAAAVQLAMQIDWTLADPVASRWLAQHGLDLARRMNRTTRLRLRRVIRAGLEEGVSTGTIAGRVQQSTRGMSTWRSRLIAQTETIGAQAEGTLQAGQRVGVDRALKRWLDLRPNHDPVCEGLHAQTVMLNAPFTSRFDGSQHMRPPAHPGCQCALRLVSVEAATIGEVTQ